MLEKSDNQLNETEAVEFLKRGLLLGTGFQLYLVAANTVDQRSSIVQHISEIPELTIRIIEGADISPQRTLVRALLENFQLDSKQGRTVIILTEIEEYVIEMPRTLSHLNMNRNELIRGFPGALLILGSSQLMARFRSEAPDTWSVRAADMEISLLDWLKPIMDEHRVPVSFHELIPILSRVIELKRLKDFTHHLKSAISKFQNGTLIEVQEELKNALKYVSSDDLDSIARLRLRQALIYMKVKEPYQAIDELRTAEHDLAKINNIPLLQQIRLLLGVAAIQAGLDREARYAWHRYLNQDSSTDEEYTIQNLVERFEQPDGKESSVVNQKAWLIINSLSQELNLYLPDTLYEENTLDDISSDGPNETLDESTQ